MNAAMALLFPPRCPGCGKSVGKEGRWCRACLGGLWDARQMVSGENRLASLDSCYVLVKYDQAVKEVLHGLKFEGRRRNAAALSCLLEVAEDGELPPRCDIAVPVPMSPARRAERGYDQVELVFRRWCLDRGMAWRPDLLKRSRNTQPQWTLNKDERKANVKGAFMSTRPESIENRSIWLLDDIFTTGSTMDACAEELKKCGARAVHGLAVAYD